MEQVQIIAKGYEWICPNCGEQNDEIEVTEIVMCDECRTQYQTETPEHAIG